MQTESHRLEGLSTKASLSIFSRSVRRPDPESTSASIIKISNMIYEKPKMNFLSTRLIHPYLVRERRVPTYLLTWSSKRIETMILYLENLWEHLQENYLTLETAKEQDESTVSRNALNLQITKKPSRSRSKKLLSPTTLWKTSLERLILEPFFLPTFLVSCLWIPSLK